MPRLSHTIIVPAPPDEVFAFYADPANLARLTPPEMRMRIISADTPLRAGSRIRFGVRPSPLPFEVHWDAVIAEFEPGSHFVDRQTRGPFEHWIHRHSFRPVEGGTEVVDEVDYGAPLGLFGRLAERLFIGSQLDGLFHYRERAIRRIFAG